MRLFSCFAGWHFSLTPFRLSSHRVLRLFSVVIMDGAWSPARHDAPPSFPTGTCPAAYRHYCRSWTASARRLGRDNVCVIFVAQYAGGHPKITRSRRHCHIRLTLACTSIDRPCILASSDPEPCSCIHAERVAACASVHNAALVFLWTRTPETRQDDPAPASDVRISDRNGTVGNSRAAGSEFA